MRIEELTLSHGLRRSSVFIPQSSILSGMSSILHPQSSILSSVPEYCRMALRRLDSESGPLFAQASIEYRKADYLTAPATAVAVADAPQGAEAG